MSERRRPDGHQERDDPAARAPGAPASGEAWWVETPGALELGRCATLGCARAVRAPA